MVRSRSLSDLFHRPFVQLDFTRQVASRLARLQFRPGTFYSTAKPYVPVVAMVGAWVAIMHTTGWQHFFLDTISVRHLASGIALAILWNVICVVGSRRQFSHTPYFKETFAACVASVACGVVLRLLHVIWPTARAVLAGRKLTMWLVGTYGILLFLSWLVSEHLIPLFHEPRRALIVGSGARARELKADLADGKRFVVMGTIDDEYLGSDPVADQYLGKISELRGLLKEKPIEVVLIALPIRSMYETIQLVIRLCETIGVDSTYMSDLFETKLAKRHDERRADHAHLTVLTVHRPDFRRLIKTAMDFVLAFVFLCLLSPLMVLIAIAVRISNPGPIFFSQLRYGLHRTRFPMIKFRTMVVDAEARQAALEALNEAEGPVFKIKKDPRITPIGRFLRKMSLDELPQLFNVMRGDMSLVGPRPLPLRDVGKFEESWLLRRFSVKPGITCLWQVTGRSNTTFDEWIQQDLEYIDTWSLMLDIKILLMTLPAVLKGRGAS